MVAVTASPRSIFPLNSLLKVEAWGREKNQCRKGRYELTCQRRRRKTPGRGELSSPRGDRSPGFARSGAAAAVPQPGVPPSAGPALPRPPPPLARRSPPRRQGPGNPPARFFVQFQQSSEEVGPFVPLFIDCVNIAKRRRRSGGPSPSLRRLLGEKSPSTRPKYTASQPPARPRPPACRFPLLLARASALPTPSRARSGKPAPRGSAPPARLRGGCGRLAQLCAQLVGSGCSPSVAHSVGTHILATRWRPLVRGSRVCSQTFGASALHLPHPSASGAPPPWPRSVRAFGPRLGARSLTCPSRGGFPRHWDASWPRTIG